MKILLINNQHYIQGGAHRVYFNTSELLQKSGHAVFHFSLKEKEMEPYENSKYFPESQNFKKQSFVSKIISAYSFIYNKKASIKLEEYIKIIKPDVAHIHLFMGGLTISVLEVLKKHKIPIVHTVHDYRLICPAYLFLNGKGVICEKCKFKNFYNCVINKCSNNNVFQSMMIALDAYSRKYYKSPYNYIDSLIFVSNFSLIKHSEYGIPTKIKTFVLHNFCTNLENNIIKNIYREYFLYFGRLSREKGVLTLIESANQTGINLKIVGDGPLLDSVISKQNDRIEILGFRSGDELKNIIKKASFIVVPSEWYENNPMTIIEAYSYGKPVIASDIGGIPEIVKDSLTGYLFRSKNIISLSEKLILADNLSDQEYFDMSRHAIDFARLHFNSENYINEIINIYKESMI